MLVVRRIRMEKVFWDNKILTSDIQNSLTMVVVLLSWWEVVDVLLPVVLFDQESMRTVWNEWNEL